MIGPGLGGLNPPSGPFASCVDACGGDRLREGETMIDEREEENGEEYTPVETEEEFHAALNSGADVELTHELAEKIGLMVEDVGTLEDIKAAKFDPYN